MHVLATSSINKLLFSCDKEWSTSNNTIKSWYSIGVVLYGFYALMEKKVLFYNGQFLKLNI